jgi:uncharacterized protein (DUF2267 family)
MKKTINLPQAQKQHIVKALQVYKVVLRTLKDEINDHEYKDFDMTCLTAMFKDVDIDIRVELPEELHDGFVHEHGVDFPIY